MNKPVSRSRWGLIVTLLFALIIFPPALYGFGSKFLDLVALVDHEEGAFAITPVLNYLLITVGFFFLLCWAIMHGMFRDVEKPKFTLLETEEKLDQDDPPKNLHSDSERTT